MNQKGISSTLIILIIVGVLVLAGGIWYAKNQKNKLNISNLSEIGDSIPIYPNSANINKYIDNNIGHYGVGYENKSQPKDITDYYSEQLSKQKWEVTRQSDNVINASIPGYELILSASPFGGQGKEGINSVSIRINQVSLEYQENVKKYGLPNESVSPELCEGKYEFWWGDALKRGQIVRGAINVGVEKGTSKEKLISILQKSDFTATEQNIDYSIFDSLGYITIKVSNGSEIKWLCRFLYNPDIKSAGLIPIPRPASFLP